MQQPVYPSSLILSLTTGPSSPPTVQLGTPIQVAPLTWKSSNLDVALVEPSTGKVTATGIGVATISALTYDGSVYGTSQLRVVGPTTVVPSYLSVEGLDPSRSNDIKVGVSYTHNVRLFYSDGSFVINPAGVSVVSLDSGAYASYGASGLSLLALHAPGASVRIIFSDSIYWDYTFIVTGPTSITLSKDPPEGYKIDVGATLYVGANTVWSDGTTTSPQYLADPSGTLTVDSLGNVKSVSTVNLNYLTSTSLQAVSDINSLTKLKGLLYLSADNKIFSFDPTTGFTLVYTSNSEIRNLITIDDLNLYFTIFTGNQTQILMLNPNASGNIPQVMATIPGKVASLSFNSDRQLYILSTGSDYSLYRLGPYTNYPLSHEFIPIYTSALPLVDMAVDGVYAYLLVTEPLDGKSRPYRLSLSDKSLTRLSGFSCSYLVKQGSALYLFYNDTVNKQVVVGEIDSSLNTQHMGIIPGVAYLRAVAAIPGLYLSLSNAVPSNISNVSNGYNKNQGRTIVSAPIEQHIEPSPPTVEILPNDPGDDKPQQAYPSDPSYPPQPTIGVYSLGYTEAIARWDTTDTRSQVRLIAKEDPSVYRDIIFELLPANTGIPYIVNVVSPTLTIPTGTTLKVDATVATVDYSSGLSDSNILVTPNNQSVVKTDGSSIVGSSSGTSIVTFTPVGYSHPTATEAVSVTRVPVSITIYPSVASLDIDLGSRQDFPIQVRVNYLDGSYDQDYSVTLSDPTLAVVEPGYITATSMGSGTITLTSKVSNTVNLTIPLTVHPSGYRYPVYVWINGSTPASGILIDYLSSITLRAHVRYTNGDVDSNVTWTSTDSIGFPTSSLGLITCKAPPPTGGLPSPQAVVTAASTRDASKNAGVVVSTSSNTVITSVLIRDDISKIPFDFFSLVGNRFKAEVLFSNGLVAAADRYVRWESDNESVALIRTGSRGYIAPGISGVANITASVISNPSVKVTIPLKVTSPNSIKVQPASPLLLDVGSYIKFKAEVGYPSGQESNSFYLSVDDSSKASVDNDTVLAKLAASVKMLGKFPEAVSSISLSPSGEIYGLSLSDLPRVYRLYQGTSTKVATLVESINGIAASSSGIVYAYRLRGTYTDIHTITSGQVSLWGSISNSVISATVSQGFLYFTALDGLYSLELDAIPTNGILDSYVVKRIPFDSITGIWEKIARGSNGKLIAIDNSGFEHFYDPSAPAGINTYRTTDSNVLAASPESVLIGGLDYATVKESSGRNLGAIPLTSLVYTDVNNSIYMVGSDLATVSQLDISSNAVNLTTFSTQNPEVSLNSLVNILPQGTKQPFNLSAELITPGTKVFVGDTVEVRPSVYISDGSFVDYKSPKAPRLFSISDSDHTSQVSSFQVKVNKSGNHTISVSTVGNKPITLSIPLRVYAHVSSIRIFSRNGNTFRVCQGKSLPIKAVVSYQDGTQDANYTIVIDSTQIATMAGLTVTGSRLGTTKARVVSLVDSSFFVEFSIQVIPQGLREVSYIDLQPTYTLPEASTIDTGATVYYTDGSIETLSSEGFLGGKGLSTKFKAPMGMIALDDGSILVCDTGNNCIRKVTANGVTSVVAGSTSPGFTNGFGAGATFNGPQDLVTDQHGNIFVADTGNHSIRRVDTNLTVTTLAGNGHPGLSDFTSTNVSNENPVGIMDSPRGIALGYDGTIYIADSNNHIIRSLDASGNLKTLAGSTHGLQDSVHPLEAKFQLPTSLALDDHNNSLYVLDTGNEAIRMINLTTGEVSTIFRGSNVLTSLNAVDPSLTLKAPQGMRFIRGALYVTDTGNSLLKKVNVYSDPSQTTLSVLAGSTLGDANGKAREAQFRYPSSLCIDGQLNIYVADTGNDRIKRVTSDSVTTLAGGLWDSSDYTIVNAFGSSVISHLPGSATLNLSFGGYSQSIPVGVTPTYSRVNLSYPRGYVVLGSPTKPLTVSVDTPHGAVSGTDLPPLAWNSSDPSILSVDPKGKLTPNSLGTCTISVNILGDDTKRAALKLAVVAKEALGVVFPSSSYYIQIGSTFKPGLTLNYNDNTSVLCDQSSIAYITSDPLVLGVDSTSPETLTAKGRGQVKLQATYTGLGLSTSAIVYSYPEASFIEPGFSTLYLNPGVYRVLGVYHLYKDPKYAPDTQYITFSSSNPTVASVDSVGGVSAHSVGATVVTAFSHVTQETFSVGIQVGTDVLVSTLGTDVVNPTLYNGSPIELNLYFELSNGKILPVVDYTQIVVGFGGFAGISFESGRLLYTGNKYNAKVPVLFSLVGNTQASLTLEVVTDAVSSIGVKGVSPHVKLGIGESMALGEHIVVRYASGSVDNKFLIVPPNLGGYDSLIVSVDLIGTIEAKAPGDTTIKILSARDPNPEVYLKLPVSVSNFLVHPVSIEILQGSILDVYATPPIKKLTASVSYSDGSHDGRVDWTSSDPLAVSIGQDGVIALGSKVSDVVITATSAKDSSLKASITLVKSSTLDIVTVPEFPVMLDVGSSLVYDSVSVSFGADGRVLGSSSLGVRASNPDMVSASLTGSLTLTASLALGVVYDLPLPSEVIDSSGSVLPLPSSISSITYNKDFGTLAYYSKSGSGNVIEANESWKPIFSLNSDPGTQPSMAILGSDLVIGYGSSTNYMEVYNIKQGTGPRSVSISLGEGLPAVGTDSICVYDANTLLAASWGTMQGGSPYTYLYTINPDTAAVFPVVLNSSVIPVHLGNIHRDSDSVYGIAPIAPGSPTTLHIFNLLTGFLGYYSGTEGISSFIVYESSTFYGLYQGSDGVTIQKHVIASSTPLNTNIIGTTSTHIGTLPHIVTVNFADLEGTDLVIIGKDSLGSYYKIKLDPKDPTTTVVLYYKDRPEITKNIQIKVLPQGSKIPYGQYFSPTSRVLAHNESFQVRYASYASDGSIDRGFTLTPDTRYLNFLTGKKDTLQASGLPGATNLSVSSTKYAELQGNIPVNILHRPTGLTVSSEFMLQNFEGANTSSNEGIIVVDAGTTVPISAIVTYDDGTTNSLVDTSIDSSTSAMVTPTGVRGIKKVDSGFINFKVSAHEDPSLYFTIKVRVLPTGSARTLKVLTAPASTMGSPIVTEVADYLNLSAKVLYSDGTKNSAVNWGTPTNLDGSVPNPQPLMKVMAGSSVLVGSYKVVDTDSGKTIILPISAIKDHNVGGSFYITCKPSILEIDFYTETV